MVKRSVVSRGGQRGVDGGLGVTQGRTRAGPIRGMDRMGRLGLHSVFGADGRRAPAGSPRFRLTQPGPSGPNSVPKQTIRVPVPFLLHEAAVLTVGR